MCDLWMEPAILDLAYFEGKKKDLSFDDLAGPVQKLAIPQHGLQNKLTKLHCYGHKICTRCAKV